MADFVRSFRDGILQIRDAAAKQLVISDCEGDLKIKVARDVREYRQRGVLGDIKKGDEQHIEWEVSAKFRAVEGVPLVKSDLRSGVTNSVTTVPVNAADIGDFTTSGEGLIGPENGAGADQVAERISWTGKSGNDLTGVTRGKDGTTAKAWNSGARLRQIDTAKRTVLEFATATGGWSGLTSTRSTTDVFCFDWWMAFTDEGANIDEIVEIADAYVLEASIDEGDDYNVIRLKGKAVSHYVNQIPPP